jgi:hypothetical protein
VAGTWRRTQRSKHVVVEVLPFRRLGAVRWAEVRRAVTAYDRFLGTEAELVRAGDGGGA